MSENDKRCGFKSECPSTIEVPAYLPKVLTEWSKAAIRTCPSDVLQWSAVYFRMKANGERPPVKPYLEPPDLKAGPGGLTPNCLKALAVTLPGALEPYEKIEKMWRVLSLDRNVFLEIVDVGKFDRHDVRPRHFVGIAAAYLSNRLRDTMILLCDTFADDNDVGISLDRFVSVYEFLARIDCADASDKPSSALAGSGDKSVASEENTSSAVSGRSAGSSRTTDDDCFENDCSSGGGGGGGGETDASKCLDAESARGIPYWVDDDRTGDPESVSDLLRRAGPPTADATTNACDDPAFLLLLERSKPAAAAGSGAADDDDDDDLLSLLSASSVISDDSPAARAAMTEDSSSASDSSLSSSSSSSSADTAVLSSRAAAAAKRVKSAAEELGDEEMTNESTTSLKVDEDSNDVDETDVNDQLLLLRRYDDDYNEAAAAAAAGEERFSERGDDDDIIKTTVERGKSDTMKKNSEANRDFIVMLALVGDGPDPPVNAAANVDDDESMMAAEENESSAESEFSLLDRTELANDAAAAAPAERAGNKADERQAEFDENVLMDFGKESSSDSGSGSDSDDVQYSEIDQQSQASVQSAAAALAPDSSDASSKDRVSGRRGSWTSSWQAEHAECAEEFEPRDEASVDDENRSRTDSSEFSRGESTELVNSQDFEAYASDETRVYVLPGIGPAVAEPQIKRVVDWATKCAFHQNGFVHAHDLLHFLCPPLDLKSSSYTDDLDIV